MKKISLYFIPILFSIFLTNCFLTGVQNDNKSDSCYDPEVMNFDQCEQSMLDFNTPEDRAYLNLTDAQKNDLLYMLQEEKVARDVYRKMAEKFNVRIFQNISISEQRHMDAVRSKINKYNIPLVGYSDDIGKFMDPAFEQLYTNLVAKGNVSLEAAIAVGIEIEELDIHDLEEKLLNAVGDINRLFTNLLSGSRRHLEAFNWWASKTH